MSHMEACGGAARAHGHSGGAVGSSCAVVRDLGLCCGASAQGARTAAGSPQATKVLSVQLSIASISILVNNSKLDNC